MPMFDEMEGEFALGVLRGILSVCLWERGCAHTGSRASPCEAFFSSVLEERGLLPCWLTRYVGDEDCMCYMGARVLWSADRGCTRRTSTPKIKENRTHNSPLQFIHSLFAHARRCTSVARHATRRSLSSLSHKSIRSSALPPKVAHAARRAPPHSRVAPAFGERERAHTYHLHSALAINLSAMIFS